MCASRVCVSVVYKDQHVYKTKKKKKTKKIKACNRLEISLVTFSLYIFNLLSNKTYVENFIYNIFRRILYLTIIQLK